MCFLKCFRNQWYCCHYVHSYSRSHTDVTEILSYIGQNDVAKFPKYECWKLSNLLENLCTTATLNIFHRSKYRLYIENGGGDWIKIDGEFVDIVWWWFFNFSFKKRLNEKFHPDSFCTWINFGLSDICKYKWYNLSFDLALI